MAISRQSDSIWALGYGHTYSPAHDDDHYKVGRGAHDHGESMGRQHASEAIHEYHRDERGRFAPTEHHEHAKEKAAGKISREHRDKFEEGYHKGFHSKIKEHEAEEKEKANKTSAFVRQAISVDPLTGKAVLDDPGRFHYKLTHGGDDSGYEPPTWLDTMMGKTNIEHKPWSARHPTEKNPHRAELDTLKNLANNEHLGLGLGMSEKAPFSPNDVGLDAGSRKDNRAYATMRPGEIASRPIQVKDHLGDTHTFVHHITAPNLNPFEEGEGGGSWMVNLHHHVSRPDGTAEWLPSEVTEHRGTGGGERSDNLYRDIWGRLQANSDMVAMYGSGAQRVGDTQRSYEYEFPHPQGDVVYRAKLANGWNKHDGYYYDALLPERHKERIAPRPRWIVTGKGLVREHAHDPNSPTRLTTIEGSDDPRYGDTISFDHEDIPGVIDHVWRGLGKDSGRPDWTRWPQHRTIPNTGGLPNDKMIKGRASVIAPVERNIHRSAERVPITW